MKCATRPITARAIIYTLILVLAIGGGKCTSWQNKMDSKLYTTKVKVNVLCEEVYTVLGNIYLLYEKGFSDNVGTLCIHLV